MEALFRAYNKEDLEVIKGLNWEDDVVKKDIIDNLEDFEGYGIVVEMAKNIVGVGVFTGEDEEVGAVMYVVPHQRHKGIGTQLLQRLEEKMKALNIKKVVMDFQEDEILGVFMERIGYIPWFKSHFMVYEGKKLELPKCTIVTYEDKDYERCQSIGSTAFHEMRLRVGLESTKALPSQEERFAYEESKENIFVLKEKEEVIGFYRVAGEELDGVAVDIEKHGQGYGRLLAIHAVNLLLDRGHKEIILWCVEGNHARYLYEKIGFKTVRIHQLMYHKLI